MNEKKLLQEIKSWIKNKYKKEKEKPLSQLEAEAKAFLNKKKD